jgi:flagella basal body P-ring formation protein FlgA
MTLRKKNDAGCSTVRIKSAGAVVAFWLFSACTFTMGEPVTLSFYDSVLVNDTIFTIGDIARLSGGDAATRGVLAAIVAGTSAPPGYARFISTADFVAGLLARTVPEVKVVFTGARRPLVRTDYHPVRIADFFAPLQQFVADSIGWKPGTWQMTVENGADSCKVLDMPLDVSFGGFIDRFPKGSAGFTMLLRQGTRTLHLPIRCRFTVAVPVLVARTSIVRDALITQDMYEIRTMDITRFAPAPFTAPEMVQGQRAARSIAAGTILYDRLLSRIPAVEKGDAVSIMITRGRITAAVSGIARERGGIGDRIWVENSTTRKLIRVEIKEKGQVVPLQGGVSI